MLFSWLTSKKPTPPQQSETASQKRILLCENDNYYTEAIQLMLCTHGFDVTVSTNGHALLDTLESDTRYDLILCGIMLPDIDGFEVRNKLKMNANLKHIPFIFLSGPDEAHTMPHGQEAGVETFFIKAQPELSRLLDLIKQYA